MVENSLSLSLSLSLSVSLSLSLSLARLLYRSLPVPAACLIRVSWSKPHSTCARVWGPGFWVCREHSTNQLASCRLGPFRFFALPQKAESGTYPECATFCADGSRRGQRHAGPHLGPDHHGPFRSQYARAPGWPSTLNLRPSTLNPQPPTLNPQSSTLNPRPSTLKPQP